MTLRVKDFNRFPWTRDDARQMAMAVPCPDIIDFTDVSSLTHCFADELFSCFSAKPTIINASAFVARIVHAVTSQSQAA